MRDKIAICVGENVTNRFDKPIRDALEDISCSMATALRRYGVRCMRLYSPHPLAKDAATRIEDYKNIAAGANEWGADGFICIDMSTAGKGRARGLTCFCNELGGNEELFAKCVYDNLYYARSKNDPSFWHRFARGVQEMPLYMEKAILLREIAAPTVYAQLGYATNRADREYILKYHEQDADALISGIRAWTHSNIRQIMTNLTITKHTKI